MSMDTGTRGPRLAGGFLRQLVWGAAALLVIGGLAASVFSAGLVARDDADDSRRTFAHESANIAAVLELALQHDDDLVVDAGAVLAGPHRSQTEFDRWATSGRVLERYPEVGLIGLLVLVRHADLTAFAAQARPAGADPARAFRVVPAGTRSSYCLRAAAIARGSVIAPPDTYDYCADPASRAALLGTRDSGLGSYVPYESAGKTWLVVQTPTYSGGVLPTTVQDRRAAFAGWVGIQLDPTSLLERAVHAESGLSVQMRYHVGVTDVNFTSGPATAGDDSVAVDLRNGWTVTTFGPVEAADRTHGVALLVLLGGVGLSVLLGLLVLVLGTGRQRARRQLVQRTSQLHHLALHDALTGLPNRALVMDRVEQMLTRDRRHQSGGALLFLDLDDFKNVNDTLGHSAGDQLLIAVTARLAGTLRGVDTIGRMGGDEFVVLLDGDASDVSPELVAQRLLDVMAQPFELGEPTVALTVNISIGIASGDRASADELLRDADIALYQAKGAGKNRFEIFDPQMQTDISRRSDIEFDLRSALTGDQYRLVYQPIYELDDLTVIGVEALLRWDHPVRGMVGPDEFIPVLEQTGQIREVGRWVLQHACHQMAAWHSRGDTLDLSVNVSARQLDHDTITEDIGDALRASGLPASSLIIEVTETALMHNVVATARRLHAIKALGVRIAVDDFGTGYSSLAYLQQFPVDCIKIDRAFTSAVTTSPESRALIGTLVQLGKDLGLATLAEGVETTEEMDILRGAEVNQAQGFLMARPLDPETLESTMLAPTRPTTPTPH